MTNDDHIPVTEPEVHQALDSLHRTHGGCAQIVGVIRRLWRMVQQQQLKQGKEANNGQ